MAAWYHLFGLLSVVCMSFGALYIVFFSDFNDVCDYSDIVANCHEQKEYLDTDPAYEHTKLETNFLRQAQLLRNDSEIEKCQIETDLLEFLRKDERKEAEAIVKKCMLDFDKCVQKGGPFTIAPPQAVDCTDCNSFCSSTNWDKMDGDYAALMGFTGPVTQCTSNSCPWLPECGVGQFIHEACSMRGCPCYKVPCDATTTTTTTSTTSTTTTTTTPATTTTTTTSTTSTTTTITTTNTTITTTHPNQTTTTTTTIITTTPQSTTTSTSTIGCYCKPGNVSTVLAGRPYATFFSKEIAGPKNFTQSTMTFWQGVAIEAYQTLPLGGAVTRGCRSTFSNRTLYVGPRASTNPSQAMASHMDLGCGYSGQFDITCKETTPGNCAMSVDISSCKPPTYSQALTACYSMPVTTTWPPSPATPTVPDWLAVEDENFTLAELPPFYNITTQTTTPAPCCEVHVGSVCRPDQNFAYPAPTKEGRWQADVSFGTNGTRKHGYFSTVPCDRQARSVPRKCPRVRIKAINPAYLAWPECLKACSSSIANARLMAICNRTKYPQMEANEKKAHEKKIASMTAKAAALESFMVEQMTTVKESKEVIDCFADRLPSRYNSLKMPRMSTGFELMPVHKKCRLHGCLATQCLEIKHPCKVPFVHDAPESMCNIHRPNGTFTCVEKMGITTNNPMSLGFGIAWMLIGAVFGCAGIATFIRQFNQDVNGENS